MFATSRAWRSELAFSANMCVLLYPIDLAIGYSAGESPDTPQPIYIISCKCPTILSELMVKHHNISQPTMTPLPHEQNQNGLAENPSKLCMTLQAHLKLANFPLHLQLGRTTVLRVRPTFRTLALLRPALVLRHRSAWARASPSPRQQKTTTSTCCQCETCAEFSIAWSEGSREASKIPFFQHYQETTLKPKRHCTSLQ